MPQPEKLSGDTLSLSRIKTLLSDNGSIALTADAKKKIIASRRRVETLSMDDRPHYGINTGFGILAGKKIATKDLETLQHNLIVSHAVGTGDLVPTKIVRLMMLCKVNALAKGYSGITLEATELLIKFFNQGITPVVYSQGSVGASGDLAPLAHLVLPLIGQSDVFYQGKRRKARDVLKREGLVPHILRSKEGLALINGTQFMLAYAVHALLRIKVILKSADIIAAMTLEAMRGSATPFDERIAAVRPHPGHKASAENVRALIGGSEIMRSHQDCQKVQDPYSLRCVPQVHGAVRDAVRYAESAVEIELGSATDNPLVYDEHQVPVALSGGNFHGEPLAIPLDVLAIAVSEIASISERRIYLLLGGDSVGGIDLPKLLMKDTGLNSGFMLPQYTAAALVSENKIFSHPASVDSIPTSLGQEDHVSMGSLSATKLIRILQNTETVLAIELMTAAQALDFLRPMTSGAGVEAAHRAIRKVVTHADKDRLFHDDIALSLALLHSEQVVKAVEQTVGKLH